MLTIIKASGSRFSNVFYGSDSSIAWLSRRSFVTTPIELIDCLRDSDLWELKTTLKSYFPVVALIPVITTSPS